MRGVSLAGFPYLHPAAAAAGKPRKKYAVDHYQPWFLHRGASPLQLDTYVSSDPHPFPLTTWTIDLYKL